MTLDEVKNALAAAGIENFSGEARILLEDLGASPDALRAAVERRCAREPLQYILGKWAFFREEYFVSPDCLIPRADTEVLVEHLVKTLPKGARILDLCTGSGCIAISLLKNRPDCTGMAADISEGALALAKKNAAHNGVEFPLLHADVTKPSTISDTFDCIVSNPPYIRTAVVDTLEAEVLCEPRIALDGGEDGMDFYRAILKNYAKNLTENGFFAFELGYDQRDAAEALAKANDYAFSAIYDYGGNFRAAIFRK